MLNILSLLPSVIQTLHFVLESANKKICSLAVIALTTACSTTPARFTWEKTFDSGIQLKQAEAQCEYDYQLQRNAEVRAGYQRGAIQIFQELRANTNPTIVACMNRFGYRAKELETTDGKDKK